MTRIESSGAFNERTRGRRVVLMALCALGASMLVAGSVVGARLHAWLAMPAEPASAIHARWRQVEEWAAVPPARADDTQLLDAADAFRTFAVRVSRPSPVVAPDQLSPEQVAALGTFVRWGASGAAYVAPACGATASRRALSTLAIFKLGQAALMTAGDAGALDKVETVLALARALRLRGGLVQVAIGFKLAELGAEWSRDRGVTFGPSFERYRPRVVEIRRELARDAVCSDHLINTATGIGFAPRELLDVSGSKPPFGLVRFARERLMFEQYYSRLLVRAEALGDNWSAIADAYYRAAQHPPKSVVLQVTMVSTTAIRNMGRALGRYDALVPAAPAASSRP
jgi:hypothetical protein